MEQKNTYWFEHIKGSLSDNHVLGICVYNWLGVRHATEKQCSDVLLIEKIYNENHARLITKFIMEKGFQKIAINGLPDNIEILIQTIQKEYAKMKLPDLTVGVSSPHASAERNPAEAENLRIHPVESVGFLRRRIKIFLIFHGSFVQQANPIEINVIEKFNKIIQISKYIHKFGFVRKDMDKIFGLLGIKSDFIPNYSNFIKFKKNTIIQNETKIGVPSPFYFYKNNLNQILASCLIKNSIVHVLDLPNINYLEKIIDKKVVSHGKLPPEKFLKLIGEMNINCYISISECYPMVFLESLGLGVPCLIGKTSEFILEDCSELKKYLLVQNPEDIFEIKDKIEQIIKDYSTVVNLCQDFIEKLLKKNKQMILDFFNT